MKLTKDEQEIINEIATNVYFADQHGKTKGKIVDNHPELIDRLHDDLQNGIEAQFKDQNGRTIRCRLTLKPSPRWVVADAVVFSQGAK